MNEYQYQKLELLRDIRTSLNNIEVALRKANGEIFAQPSSFSTQFSLSGNAQQVAVNKDTPIDIKKQNPKEDNGYSSF
jgi:hypothetical protein